MTQQPGTDNRKHFSLRRIFVAGLVLAALPMAIVPTQAHAQNGRWLHEDHSIVLGFGCTPFYLEPFDARFNCPDGWRVHEAIDFDTPEGTRVYAGLPGIILNVGGRETKDYGPNYVRMLLPDGHDLILGHLSSTLVKPGAGVAQGDLIGYTGNLGVTNWPNLHFEVRPHDGTTYTSINPAPYLTLGSVPPTASANPAAKDGDEGGTQTAGTQPIQQQGMVAPVTTQTGQDPAQLVANLAPLAPMAPVPAVMAMLVLVMRRRRRQRPYLHQSLVG